MTRSQTAQHEESHQNIAINSLPNTAPYTPFSTFSPACFCLPPPVPTILKYFLQGGEHDYYDCSFSLAFSLLIAERHKTLTFTLRHSTAHKTTPGRAGHTGIPVSPPARESHQELDMLSPQVAHLRRSARSGFSEERPPHRTWLRIEITPLTVVLDPGKSQAEI